MRNGGGLAGIEAGAVDRWLAGVLPTAEPPFSYELITGGHSNLTYAVTDIAGQRWVLRRPPLGPLLPTAHDMAREFRILSALAATPVPVPAVVALCQDGSVTGAPFYVMAAVDGIVVRDEPIAERLLDEPARRNAGLSIAATLAAIHAVDPAAVGLGDLGRPGDYIARQLRRWKRQLDQSKTRELPALDRLVAQLEERRPAQRLTTIVHGDFRLDNCIIGPDGAVRAVLDWELCTLGDPFADLGLVLVYWNEPGDDLRVTPDSPTALPGFPGRAELLERYAQITGQPLPDLDFYVAFSYWRLACINEGVLARYEAGGMGDRQAEAKVFRERIGLLIEGAERITRSW
jgi:aminoglycoside phosphotransferase (APT) family kinase protein